MTPFDKALAAFLVPLIILANQRWGLALPVDPTVVGALVVGLTGVAVYLVPNKAKPAAGDNSQSGA